MAQHRRKYRVRPTRRQIETLAWMVAFVEQWHRQPQLAETAFHFGISVCAARQHVLALERHGLVRVQRDRRGRWRGCFFVGVEFRAVLVDPAPDSDTPMLKWFSEDIQSEER